MNYSASPAFSPFIHIASPFSGSPDKLKPKRTDEQRIAHPNQVGVSYELARRVGITDAFFNGSMHFGGHASLCAVMALGGQQVRACGGRDLEYCA